MRLVLDVTSFQKSLMGAGGRHVFDEAGGVIGRGRRCDWILPDPNRFVSATHAEISYDGECFLVADISTNGVFVNGSSIALGKGRRWPISDGDQMAIGDFEIVARIEAHVETLADALTAPSPNGPQSAPIAVVPSIAGTSGPANHDTPHDTEPDQIPPFPDPAVLKPPPRPVSGATAADTRQGPPAVSPPNIDSAPRSVPPPPPRWVGGKAPALVPSDFKESLRPMVETDKNNRFARREPQSEPSTLEAEYNAAIADLDLEKLVGSDQTEDETPARPTGAPIPPPPPALGRAPRGEHRVPRPEATPPTADIPVELPGDASLLDPAPRIPNSRTASDGPLSPDAIEAALRLPTGLSETERKARLWDEFIRLHRLRHRSTGDEP